MGRFDDEDLDSRGTRAGGRSDLMEAVDMLGRRLGGAIVLAGLLIGVGVYWSSDEVEAPTYQAFAVDGELFRVNMDSGTIIACNAQQQCRIVLERGQDLAEDQDGSLFKIRVERNDEPPAAQPKQIAPPAPEAPAAPQPPAQPQPAQPKQ
jgi:hypothetical protein